MNINFDITNDTINYMCSRGKEPKATLHYLLRCNLYSIYRLELLNNVSALNRSLKNSLEEKLLKILLYAAEDLTSQSNSEILKCTIKFIKKSDCFSGPLSLSQFLFYFFFSLSIQYLIFLYVLCFLCSIYVQNLQQAVYVFCKFSVLCCFIYFLFLNYL